MQTILKVNTIFLLPNPSPLFTHIHIRIEFHTHQHKNHSVYTISLTHELNKQKPKPTTNNKQYRTTGRKSSESIELQPLHQMANKTPKGVLRRMPRVRSDEIHGETDEHHEPVVPPPATVNTTKEKSPSPIGAGLPLLQRLRLLKEKQVSSIVYAKQ